MAASVLKVYSFLLIFSYAYVTSCYKILGIFPFYSRSHYFLGNELIKGLAQAGHEATILTVYREENPPNENYKQIVLDGLADQQKGLLEQMTNMSHEGTQDFYKNPLKMMSRMIGTMETISAMTLNHTATQQLIKSNSKYDVVIVTQFFFDSLKALAPLLDAHLVLFSNHGGMSSWLNNFVGNPTLPSMSSELLLGYTGQMNFKQRLINTLFRSVQYLMMHRLVYPGQNELVHQYISKNLDLYETLYNVSLVLTNSHTSLVKASSYVPCMKDIAGFHVRPPKKLPANLKKYLDESKHGVIYFSMGSNVKSADFPDETKRALVNVFAKRKENILWKFEDDTISGKPQNVRIEKWLPQADLLAHPNVKLFITHGGFLSTIETIYHGVATIAFPAFADQLANAKQAESDGYSKTLDIKTVTEEEFNAAIEEMISNKTYSENAKARSRIFHDRQVTAMDEAIYWIEYIVRHHGANHLRVGYLGLAWYQYYLLDVFAVIFGLVFLVLFIIKRIILFVLHKLCKKEDKKGKNKKPKKE